MEITNIIKSFIKGRNKKAFSARDAYMTSRYGEIISTEKMLSNFFEKAEETIRSRAQAGHFSTIIELNTDLVNYTDQIAGFFTQQNYNVIVLNSDAEVNGKQLKGLSLPFMVVIWANMTDEPVENRTIKDAVKDASTGYEDVYATSDADLSSIED